MAEAEYDPVSRRSLWLVAILGLMVVLSVVVLCANVIVQDHDYYGKVIECVKAGQTVNACTDALRDHSR